MRVLDGDNRALLVDDGDFVVGQRDLVFADGQIVGRQASLELPLLETAFKAGVG